MYLRMAIIYCMLFAGLAATLRGQKMAADPIDHSRLTEYRAADGRALPVRTKADWDARRRQIIEGMEAAMGALPDRSKLPLPEIKIIERVEIPRFIRLDIRYLAEQDDWVPAYLYLPKNRPAEKEYGDAGRSPDGADGEKRWHEDNARQPLLRHGAGPPGLRRAGPRLSVVRRLSL